MQPNAVFPFDRRGNVVRQLSGDRAANAGLILPMGIASDSKGNIWVSNSGVLRAPCKIADSMLVSVSPTCVARPPASALSASGASVLRSRHEVATALTVWCARQVYRSTPRATSG